MSGEAPVLLAVEDGVARVTLNRPDAAEAASNAAGAICMVVAARFVRPAWTAFP
jgi:hypothetical protein